MKRILRIHKKLQNKQTKMTIPLLQGYNAFFQEKKILKNAEIQTS